MAQQAKKKYLTPGEVAEKMGVHVNTVRNRRLRGDLPPFIGEGKHVLYPRDKFEKWLREVWQKGLGEEQG